jgi:hypothetical protein
MQRDHARVRRRSLDGPAPHVKSVARRCTQGELPSDPHSTDPPEPEAMQKAPSQFIVAARAQASKPAPGLNRGRCETQAPLSGKPLSSASVSVR